jgi:hypothetical protein
MIYGASLGQTYHGTNQLSLSWDVGNRDERKEWYIVRGGVAVQKLRVMYNASRRPNQWMSSNVSGEYR